MTSDRSVIMFIMATIASTGTSETIARFKIMISPSFSFSPRFRQVVPSISQADYVLSVVLRISPAPGRSVSTAPITQTHDERRLSPEMMRLLKNVAEVEWGVFPDSAATTFEHLGIAAHLWHTSNVRSMLVQDASACVLVMSSLPVGYEQPPLVYDVLAEEGIADICLDSTGDDACDPVTVMHRQALIVFNKERLSEVYSLRNKICQRFGGNTKADLYMVA